MKRLTDEIIRFFHNQNFVIVSTIDENGTIHNSCKGIASINNDGLIYLLDLYRGKTHLNLKCNHHISITAVDEHKFKGYCLKGKARIIPPNELEHAVIKDWENRITGRITQRLLKNMREGKGHPRHPEALLPKPEYLIVMKTEEIIDLTPQHIKGGL